ncbi:TlpA family protein disulfide reductase [Pedobacter sp. PWIIR3]
MKTLFKQYLLIFLSACGFCSQTNAAIGSTVKISGTSVDMKDNSISVRSLNTFLNDRSITYLASQRNETGEFSLAFELKRPELVIFGAFFKNWYINMRPGDSVTFKIVGKDAKQQLEFYGKEAARYNFDVLVSVEIDKASRMRYKNLAEFKTQLDQWKKNSDDSIKMYLAKHMVDKHVALGGLGRLNYQYVRSLYYTASIKSSEIIPPGYYLQADKNHFNKDIFLRLPEYRDAIYFKYIANVQTNHEKPIEFVYQQIQSSLRGKARVFALASLTGAYARKGAVRDSAMLRKIFRELYAERLDSSYLAYLKDSEMRYFVIGKPLPRNVLETTVTIYNRVSSLNLLQLLNAYKGKAVYFDLWASWCGPCRSDIETSSDIKKFLADNNIPIVYLSTDVDELAWKKASEQDKVTENQFRFSTGNKNPLTAFIGLEGIPRYIFLDKDHNVKTLYAPRPYSSDKRLFEKLVEEMNAAK